ncbi:MAG TPA: cache domain-containing protein [Candidatus Nitrosocosmicus sp.]|nr:cache domain-containing protein [Candidatus Nitrosocosmicus sp.]
MTFKLTLVSIGIIILLFSFTMMSILLPLDSFSISLSDSFFNTTESNLSNRTNGTVDNSTLLSLKVLTNSLENRLQGAASMLEFAANLSEMRSIPNPSLLNATLETLHGIPPDSDLQKRIIAQKVVSYYPEIAGISFIMPNGDTYFMEPYSLQSNQTKNNLAFRDYFKGAIASNDTYLGDIITSTSSGLKRAIIAVPVFSTSDDDSGVLRGVLVGSIDLSLLNKEIQSLNLSQGQRIVYVDSNNTKIADSDKRSSTNNDESFFNLESFQNAIKGMSGSMVEEVNQEKMLISYHPMDAIQNRWIILWMQPITSDINYLH